ncbi:hypothetical protein QO002_005851 [Pararhizobium capsulatum DSM 1112]|uniref:Uncharacterized protein n=1 Tax=Pararhizobium capsulatum DSM 1112 TaxID=1121113 RepID=A0ABU0BZH9_9HYPH|nr:hypothetical protein [Pararhizobium capsulatum]MDQ0323644.1 hypothetical protein [Pararhizobium capsulatum DSM 1112]
MLRQHVMVIALVVGIAGLLTVSLVHDRIARQAVQVEQDAKLSEFIGNVEKIEASSDPDGKKSKEVIDLVISANVGQSAFDKQYPLNPLRNRVLDHVLLRHQNTFPLQSTVFERMADIDCLNQVSLVSTDSDTFTQDINDKWRKAYSDFRQWQPYLSNSKAKLRECADRFHARITMHEEYLAKNKPLSVRIVGEEVGQATSEVSEWWDGVTKPITDVVDEFKSGYEGGK